ncbi:hypothetical protein BJY01DRAFT_250371 [Aspergillus pseudoustus]|uniref:Uncharacterized protein n=1 Tax=Aspergillus pseudoustus TaxID=1810923 RepID=A0ABR4JIR0_9EURO
MECLDIPVDHRLMSFIRGIKIPNYTRKSTHLEILQRWGAFSRYGKAPIPSAQLHHALELAKPATKGGVLVVLLEPYRKQTFGRGFTADQQDCPTTRAVCDLIETATGGRMSADDVSIFDTTPYCPDGTTDEDVLREARIEFRKMVEAKQPDVVICCHQNKSDQFVKLISSLGVGKVFLNPYLLLGGEFTTKRVNAFHPSYAVNYHPTYSCFRRLLLVEFVQAFWYCSGGQSLGESSVKKLRVDCRSRAQALCAQTAPINQSKIEEPASSCTAEENRWENILSDLEEKLQGLGLFNEDITVDAVVDSELSWLCADASLLLDELEKKFIKGNGKNLTECIKAADTLLDYLAGWCQSQHLLIKKPGIEASNRRGFFEPRDLLNVPAPPEDSPTRELHAHFSAFLNDLNFSFSWERYPNYTWDTMAQRNAFKRFAANLERSFARENNSLEEIMQALDI